MYRGNIHPIYFGQGGLHTDDPHTQIPPTDLIRALNISYEGNKVSKAPGAIRYNRSVLSASVVGAIDWWPNDVIQRLIAITSDGKIWRMDDIVSQQQISNVTDSTQSILNVTNQVMLVQGGAEEATFNRKLFIFTGNNPVQVLSGDAITTYNISMPPVDWSGLNQPTAGLIHNGRLWTWGNRNSPHTLYASNPDDHEDFLTNNVATIWPVYPGEQQAILACYVFKGRLFIFKYPFGIYYLDDTDPDTNNWIIRKYMDNFGAASAHSGITVLNDMLIANSFGTITSANAVQYYGGFDLADVLVNTRTAKYVRENISPLGNISRHAIYYEYKKQAFFSYRSTSSPYNDQMLYIDYGAPETPKVSWWNHLQANCLFLRRDINNVPRPCFGANDGYIYLMDQKNSDVAGVSYRMDVMTPSLDCSQSQGPVVSEINKIFDFLELTIECSGKWDLFADIFLDGKFSETLHFTQSLLKGTNEFRLNVDRTYDGAPFQVRKKMHGYGKRISIRLYNEGLDQNITILKAQVYYRPGAHGDKNAS